MNPNFTLLKEEYIEKFKCKGIYLEHKKTKAKVFHILNDNDENTFMFCFNTIPDSDNGIPHIMEHSVLAGTKKYPIKEPFMHLIKTSPATFMNAMTGSIYTIYPAASIIKKDVLNCMDVYMDAVFNPLLSKETFSQEAHRFVVDSNKAKITGVVYNEMKSDFSTKYSIQDHKISKAIMPNLKYSNNSGGHPESIPDLTYEEFLDFHDTFYHPSNCFVSLSGNIPTDTYLEKLEEYFSKFDFKETDIDIGEEPLWSEPRQIEDTFIGSKEDKSDLIIGYLIKIENDLYKEFLLEILAQALMGLASSPLQKAITDSGLGNIHEFSGLERNKKYSIFFAGISEIEDENIQKCEDLILKVIEKFSKESFDAKLLDSIIQKYLYKEKISIISSSGMPNGLNLSRRVFSKFMNGYDPFETFYAFDKNLQRFQKDYKENPSLFQNLIKDNLMNNNNRVTMYFKPDPEFVEKENKKEEQRCLKFLQDENQKNQSLKENEKLKNILDNDDSQKANEILPKLYISDMPKKIKSFDIKNQDYKGIKILSHKTFSNDVVFLKMAFDLNNKISDFRILPILSALFSNIGTKNYSTQELSNKISKYIGSISFSPEVFDIDSKPSIKMIVGISFLKNNTVKALELLNEIIHNTVLIDKNKLKEIFSEVKSNLKNSIIPRGHMISVFYTSSFLSQSSYLQESFQGISLLKYINSINETQIEEAFDNLKDNIFTKDNLQISVVSDKPEDNLGLIQSVILDKISSDFTSFKLNLPKTELADNQEIKLIQFPSQGSFCSISFKTELEEDFVKRYASQNVLNFQIMDYLLNEVRFRGGAYGCEGIFRSRPGILSFFSYRDPNNLKTLEHFEKSIKVCIQNKLDLTTLEKYKISSLSKYIEPKTPSQICGAILTESILGISLEEKQAIMDNIYALSADDLIQEAKQLFEKFEKFHVSAILTDPQVVKSDLSNFKDIFII